MSYDHYNQIQSATNPEAPTLAMQNESFTYDPKFNRTNDNGGSYTYDSASERLTQDYRFNYSYDNNGNLIQKTNVNDATNFTKYSYNSNNRLVSVNEYLPGSSNPSVIIGYIYDALGRRIQKSVSNNSAPSDPTKTYTRRFAYDGAELLCEFDGNNNILAQYTNSNLSSDDVLAVNITSTGTNAKMSQNPGSFMFLKDQLGSIVDIADTNGTRLQHYIYSAYGLILGIQDASGTDISTTPVLNTSRTFAGREFEPETGLYFNRARFYDPSIGRFISVDPLGRAGQNSYAYANNNPLIFVDPSGNTVISIGIGGTYNSGPFAYSGPGSSQSLQYGYAFDTTTFSGSRFSQYGTGDTASGAYAGAGFVLGITPGSFSDFFGSSTSTNVGGGIGLESLDATVSNNGYSSTIPIPTLNFGLGAGSGYQNVITVPDFTTNFGNTDTSGNTGSDPGFTFNPDPGSYYMIRRH